MEALVEVRDELRDLVDIQVVALIALPTAGPGGANHRALLRDALDMRPLTAPTSMRIGPAGTKSRRLSGRAANVVGSNPSSSPASQRRSARTVSTTCVYGCHGSGS